MSTSSPQIRVATVDDREAIVATIVAAFADDPAFGYFFPDDERFAREAPVFVGALLDARLAQQATWVMCADGPRAAPPATDDAAPDRAPAGTSATREANPVMAVAMWAVPGGEVHGADLSALPSDTRDRLEVYDAATDKALPDSPIWYLGVLATHPAHQGHGHGRAVMQQGLAAARAAGHRAYLETTNAANVGLYERSGWVTTDVVTLPHPPDDLVITVMRA